MTDDFGAFRVNIVGGGIGGVAFGAALHHFGFRFRIFEQAQELKAVGYGLTLQKNAIQALATVGIGDAIRQRGADTRQGQIRQPFGRVLARAPVELCAIHRATLLAALAEHVPAESLMLGQRVDAVTDAMDADLVVAADGLRSIFRAAIAPGEGPVRDSGYTAWRGLAPRTPAVDQHLEHGAVSETWGRGRRFGIVPINGDQVYWFAVAPVAPFMDRARARDFLLGTFSDWHAPIEALLKATPADDILESRIVDRLPIERWYQGNVVLIGDAAHPMTPNLGQGGCQAIEDAVVLAHLLRACRDGRFALAELGPRFDAHRRARVREIVDQSFAIGRLANQANPLFVALRDALFRMMPARMQEQRLARIVTFPGNPTP